MSATGGATVEVIELNQRPALTVEDTQRTLTKEDLAQIVRRLIELNNAASEGSMAPRPEGEQYPAC